MRVTVDIDSKWWNDLFRVLEKGFELGLGMPNEIRKTRRGYHIIWRGLSITKEECLELRKKLGDDEKRIMLDQTKPYKPFQVLFTKKRIRKI